VAIRILAIGDVVGRPGRRFLKCRLPEIVARENIDLVVVNGENAASGLGITRALAKEIHGCGADVITTGDHVWRRQDVRQALTADRTLLRPHNYPAGAPGSGVAVVKTKSGIPVRVVNLQGRIFMDPIDCPFECLDALLRKAPEPAITIVDFHAEATSEKGAIAWAMDGRITAVLGTHTHVQTADERILERGTALLTDMGMTGAVRSVLGRKVEQVIQKFRSRVYVQMDVADGETQMGGAIVTADPATGRALDIQRILERGYVE